MAKEISVYENIDLLTDKYAKKILMGCYDQPMTAQHLSWEYNIPIAATYRRIKDLNEAGFIEEVNEDEGNNASKYKTSLEKAVLTFEKGDFSIKVKMEEDELISEF